MFHPRVPKILLAGRSSLRRLLVTACLLATAGNWQTEEAKADPLAPDDLAAFLPANTLFYVSLPDLQNTAKEYRQTAAYRIFQDEEMQKFLEPLLDETTATPVIPGLGTSLELDVLTELSLMRLAFAVTHVDPGDSSLEAFGAIIDVQPTEDDQSWDKIVRWLKESLEEIGGDIKRKAADKLQIGAIPVDVHPARFGQLHIARLPERRTLLTFSRKSMEMVLKNYQRRRLPLIDPPKEIAPEENPPTSEIEMLAEHEAFRMADERMPRDGDEYRLYVGVPKLLEAVLSAIEPDATGSDEARRVVEALGLFDIRSAGTACQFQGRWVYTHSTLVTEVNSQRGLLSLIPSKPLETSLLRFVPRDAITLGFFSLDAVNLWKLIKSISEILDPKPIQDWERRMVEIQEEDGVDFNRDFLEQFTGELIYYQSIPSGAMLDPGIVLIAKLTDGAAMRTAIDHIWKDTITDEVRRIEYKGVDTFVFKSTGAGPLPVQPCYGFPNDTLVFALNTLQLRRAIDQILGDSESILDNPTFDKAKQAAQVPDSIISLTYYDVPQLFHRVYSGATMFAPMILSTRSEPLPVDLAALPTSLAFTQYLSGSMGYATADGRGLQMRSASPLGPELFGLTLAGTLLWTAGVQPAGAQLVETAEAEQESEEKAEEKEDEKN